MKFTLIEKYILNEKFILTEAETETRKTIIEDRILKPVLAETKIKNFTEKEIKSANSSNLLTGLNKFYETASGVLEKTSKSETGNVFSIVDIVNIDKIKKELEAIPDTNTKAAKLNAYISEISKKFTEFSSNWRTTFPELDKALPETTDGKNINLDTLDIIKTTLDRIVNKGNNKATKKDAKFEKFDKNGIAKAKEILESFKNNIETLGKDIDKNRPIIEKLFWNIVSAANIIADIYFGTTTDTKTTLNKLNDLLVGVQPVKPADGATRIDWAQRYKDCQNAPDKKAAYEKFWQEYYMTEWPGSTEKIKEFGAAFLRELEVYGFNSITNPFIAYLKSDIIKNKIGINNISTAAYSAIHNAFVNNKLTAGDLRGKGTFKEDNIIFCRDLLKKNYTDAIDYLSLQYTVNQYKEKIIKLVPEFSVRSDLCLRNIFLIPKDGKSFEEAKDVVKENNVADKIIEGILNTLSRVQENIAILLPDTEIKSDKSSDEISALVNSKIKTAEEAKKALVVVLQYFVVEFKKTISDILKDTVKYKDINKVRSSAAPSVDIKTITDYADLLEFNNINQSTTTVKGYVDALWKIINKK